MKKVSVIALACMVLFCVAPAMAQVIDLAGPWILDFPQGQGLAELRSTGGSPSSYRGMVTLPGPNGPYKFRVHMTTAPSSVQPGNMITFQPESNAHIQFFLMNLGSGSNGVAWIQATSGAPAWIRNLYGVKAPAHR